MGSAVSNGLGQSKELHSLAGSLRQSAEGLSEIFVAVTALFERQASHFSPTERAMAADILKRISKDVEMSLRIALAEKLADRDDAPVELIVLLADDRIEVARPVLMRSPVLPEADLVRILCDAGDDHSLAIAQRPRLDETVTAAIARSQCEAVLIALLRNEGAKISDVTFQSLVERAKSAESLQEPLVRRKDLPAQLAANMYTWVSGALKQALAARYPEVAPSVALALDDTTALLKAGKLVNSADTAKKLVDKLNAAGQIKASFVVRALQQGNIELFEQAFATLLKLNVDRTRNLLYGNNFALIALACHAAGIDRAVFPTVLRLSRELRGKKDTLPAGGNREIDDIFLRVQRLEALARVRALAV
jgi:uncharacterized protein (DUF2336 family)